MFKLIVSVFLLFIAFRGIRVPRFVSCFGSSWTPTTTLAIDWHIVWWACSCVSWWTTISSTITSVSSASTSLGRAWFQSWTMTWASDIRLSIRRYWILSTHLVSISAVLDWIYMLTIVWCIWWIRGALIGPHKASRWVCWMLWRTTRTITSNSSVSIVTSTVCWTSSVVTIYWCTAINWCFPRSSLCWTLHRVGRVSCTFATDIWTHWASLAKIWIWSKFTLVVWSIKFSRPTWLVLSWVWGLWNIRCKLFLSISVYRRTIVWRLIHHIHCWSCLKTAH